jgi:hypothetical protein
LAVAWTAGVAAISGRSHPAILPGQPPIMSPELANLCRYAQGKPTRDVVVVVVLTGFPGRVGSWPQGAVQEVSSA